LLEKIDEYEMKANWAQFLKAEASNHDLCVFKPKLFEELERVVERMMRETVAPEFYKSSAYQDHLKNNPAIIETQKPYVVLFYEIECLFILCFICLLFFFYFFLTGWCYYLFVTSLVSFARKDSISESSASASEMKSSELPVSRKPSILVNLVASPRAKGNRCVNLNDLFYSLTIRTNDEKEKDKSSTTSSPVV
jgi:hypothetical protein